MLLSEIISQDLKKAMLAREKDRLEALRAVKTAFTLERSNKGTGVELSGEEEIRIIQKLVKQRRESAEIYRSQNRNDLADKEIIEADVIEAYLPEQMGSEELRAFLLKMIAELGASGMKDMGRVMGQATKALAGKAEGKAVSAMVSELLEKQ
ncbi:MAG: GatB/YqeY domain-containing protein [Bacteroidota bacterium]